jgi:hypothetical protein
MKTYLKIISIQFFIFIAVWQPHCSYAIDTVFMAKPRSTYDIRREYGYELIETILKATEPDFGSYEFKISAPKCSRKRELQQLKIGKLINVSIVPDTKEWEDNAIPIRIPVKKGVLGYKIFLIRKDKRDLFSKINSIEELKELKGGGEKQWTTTSAMEKLGFNLVAGSDYEGLFRMLAVGRFDYFPRGVTEIFDEIKSRPVFERDCAVEESLAIYFPLPVYIFVSPLFPKLAVRLEAGFKKIIADGSFDKLFFEYYSDSLCKAKLKDRKIFRMNNPLLPPGSPFDNKSLWYDPDSFSRECTQ